MWSKKIYIKKKIHRKNKDQKKLIEKNFDQKKKNRSIKKIDLDK